MFVEARPPIMLNNFGSFMIFFIKNVSTKVLFYFLVDQKCNFYSRTVKLQLMGIFHSSAQR